MRNVHKKSIYLLFLIVSFAFLSMKNKEVEIIIDSQMTFEEATKETKAPKEVLDSMILLDIKYYSFDHKIHSGQILINKSVKRDIQEIFKRILDEKFPINKAIPISKYNWSDDASMEDNNTSAFNYRNIAGTNRLSNHSFGRAIDINPQINPVLHKDGTISPSNGKYEISKTGTFSQNNFVVKEFLERGWRWGGNFSQYKDNHHFDKTN